MPKQNYKTGVTNRLPAHMERGYQNFLPERGSAREEFYRGTGKPKEQFGLAKRTLRRKRGEIVSKKDGTIM